MKKKVCLLSITASHYRSRIYQEMQRHMDCSFILGIDNSSVKRMDTSLLKDSVDVQNKYISHTNWYWQPRVVGMTKDYEVLINDLGIFSLTAWMLLFAARFRHQRIYNWDHGWYGRENLIKKILKRIYFGLATGSFIYGDYAIRLMKENGFNADKLFPIHNSLDYDSQLLLRRRISGSQVYSEHFGNDYPVLIMIGRLNLRKHLDMLLHAVSMLRQRQEHYNIVLVGDGEDRAKLESLTAQLNLQKQVWFYGACYDEETNAELIYNADMCVVPGDIGLTAIHALMFGCPSMSHNYYPSQGPEFEVIREGQTGTFFENGSIDSLAQAISRWFADKSRNREEIRQACFGEIDNGWTPRYQLEVLKKVINA